MSIPESTEFTVPYLGPNFISTILQAVELGVLLAQHMTFWSRTDHCRGSKWIVICITLFGLIQTCLAIDELWSATVIGFGDWAGLLRWTVHAKLTNLVTCMMAFPVQSFLIWRCWVLCNRNSALLFVMTSLLLIYIGACLGVSIQLLRNGRDSYSVNDTFDNPIYPLFIVCLIVPAILDVILTTVLLLKLTRSRATVITPSFRRVLRRVIQTTWETAIPPCACAIAAVILYGVTHNFSLWYRPFQAILGKLYIISLLATLNTRNVTELTSGKLDDWKIRTAEPVVTANNSIRRHSSRRSQTPPRKPRLSDLRFASFSEPNLPIVEMGARLSTTSCTCGQSNCCFRRSFGSSGSQIGSVHSHEDTNSTWV